MRFVVHVACIEGMADAYNVLLGELEGKRQL
jgi:hypothetical protein